MYGKLFTQMYDGTLVSKWQALVTFQQMIILCGPDGVIDMTPSALSDRTGIPLKIIRAGIAELEKPDPSSRTRDMDGRRIERLDDHRDWGWRLVNYRKYRLTVDPEVVRLQNASRQRAHRARKDGAINGECHGENVTERDEALHEETNVTVAASNAESRQVEGEEGKRVGRASRFKLSELPKDWEAFCRKERPDLDPSRTFLQFSDYWAAIAGQKGRKEDWLAVWRYWVRNERGTPASKGQASDEEFQAYLRSA